MLTGCKPDCKIGRRKLYMVSIWDKVKKSVVSKVGFGFQNGDLKSETESLIVAAQNQSIRTNWVKAKVDKTQKETLCRLCKKADESIDHVVGGCSKLAQKDCKRRHDNLGKIVH